MMEQNSSSPSQHIPNADLLVEKFGGIRPMATKLAIPVTTVQGWKKRGVIPANRLDQIRQTAEALSIDLGGLLQLVEGGEPGSATGVEPRSAVVQADVGSITDSVSISSPVRAAVMSSALSASASARVVPPWSEGSPASLPPLQEASKESEAVSEPVSASTSFVEPSSFQQEAIGIVDSKPTSSREKPLQFNRRRSDRYANAVWGAVMVLAVAIVVGLMAMGPGVARIVSQEKRLAAMETELQQIDDRMQAVNGQNSLLMGMVPDDFRAQVKSLQARAATIEQTVASIGTQARALTEGVMGANAGTIEQRLSHVEDQMKRFAATTGSQQLSSFLLRVQQFQYSDEGRKVFAAANTALQGALASAPIDTDDKLQKALAGVLKSSPELQQTLAGLDGNEMKAAAMLLTLTQLRRTLDRDHQSFDVDLQILRNMVATDNPDLLAAIDRLSPKAKSGVLTPQGLSREFRGLAGEIVTASLAGKDVSVSEKFQARLHDVLKIERDGRPVTGTATQQAIDIAQKRLDAGDVAGAIDALQGLDGKAAEVAAPWVNQAETTLLARQVSDMLTRTVSAKISLQPFVRQMGGAGQMNVQALTQGLVQSLGALQLPGSYVHDPKSGFSMTAPPTTIVPPQILSGKAP